MQEKQKKLVQEELLKVSSLFLAARNSGVEVTEAAEILADMIVSKKYTRCTRCMMVKPASTFTKSAKCRKCVRSDNMKKPGWHEHRLKAMKLSREKKREKEGRMTWDEYVADCKAKAQSPEEKKAKCHEAYLKRKAQGFTEGEVRTWDEIKEGRKRKVSEFVSDPKFCSDGVEKQEVIGEIASITSALYGDNPVSFLGMQDQSCREIFILRELMNLNTRACHVVEYDKETADKIRKVAFAHFPWMQVTHDDVNKYVKKGKYPAKAKLMLAHLDYVGVMTQPKVEAIAHLMHGNKRSSDRKGSGGSLTFTTYQEFHQRFVITPGQVDLIVPDGIHVYRREYKGLRNASMITDGFIPKSWLRMDRKLEKLEVELPSFVKLSIEDKKAISEMLVQGTKPLVASKLLELPLFQVFSIAAPMIRSGAIFYCKQCDKFIDSSERNNGFRCKDCKRKDQRERNKIESPETKAQKRENHRRFRRKHGIVPWDEHCQRKKQKAIERREVTT